VLTCAWPLAARAACRFLQERGCITYQDGPISLEGLEDAGPECCAVLSHVDNVAVADCGEHVQCL
jgi:hypothetical protein